MSVEFNLSGGEFDLPGVKRVLEEWRRQQPLEFYDEPTLQGDDVTGYHSHIWGPGSIRGVLVSYHPHPNCVSVRFNAFASRQDWRNGFSFLRSILAKTGGELTRQGSWNCDPCRLTDERAEQEAIEDFCKSSRIIFENSRREAKIPLGSFSVKLTPEQLPPCKPRLVPEVESRLAQRIERYATAHRMGTWRDESGAECGYWDLAAALVPSVDLVQIKAGDSFKLPFRRLKALLGERAENCGEWTYLPALGKQGVARLKKAASMSRGM